MSVFRCETRAGSTHFHFAANLNMYKSFSVDLEGQTRVFLTGGRVSIELVTIQSSIV